ncbi:MAG: GNAT family N-acetyltransferase [Chloroflexota bacterium]|nr:GNAT family N-acetyltransferase [Chloroflexota bacterium]
MTDSVEIITVNATNIEEHGFFCYKSKPKSHGYQKKLQWLQQRFTEGLRIKILYEGSRSVGFIEYIPGEHTWRVVEAPNYLVVHCLWVVGRGKEKGYGSRLLDECVEDARQEGKHGVVMVSSRGNWLANEKIFLKNGFENLDSAPPSFNLLVKKIKAGAEPVFPQDWEARLGHYSSGVTIVYADQCPYMPDAVQQAVDEFASRGIEAKVVRLESSAEVRAKSPTAYGVFGIVYDGRLLTYHYLGKKELRRLDEEFLLRS